jgi:hypothetical protein
MAAQSVVDVGRRDRRSGKGNLMSHLAFSPYTEAAHAFVYSTFWDSLRVGADLSKDERVACERALKRAMLDPSTKAVLAHPAGHQEELFGWAVSTPDFLAYVYVVHSYRRSALADVMGDDGRHLGSQLIRHVDGVWPVVPAALWTRDSSRMAAAGYPIRYDLDQAERFMRLAR